MTFLRKIPKPPKRSTRWRSQAHCNHIRSFECVGCGSRTNVVVAHVRLGSHTGIGQKPDDWRGVPLCEGPNSDIGGMLGCHNRQHLVGEDTFWKRVGKDPEAIINELIAGSPKRTEIQAEIAGRMM